MMKGGLRVLLVSLLLLLVLYPFIEWSLPGKATYVLLSTVIALSGSYASSQTRRHLAIALLLAMPALVGRWGYLFTESPRLGVVATVASMAFLVYTGLLVLVYVLRAEQVTSDHTYGAVSVYILIGFTWAMAYRLVEGAVPGSFHTQGVAGPYELTYFSFTTLMTIGYGDISPVTPVARSLAILEALAGIMFTAVFIARVVGMHSGGPRR